MLARVGREMQFDEQGRWADLTFVIDEGPRFVIRNVSFAGNGVLADNQLVPLLDLKAGDFFDLAKMNKDVAQLTEAYGSQGYILADINPSPRTLEGEPAVDLVYDMCEKNKSTIVWP